MLDNALLALLIVPLISAIIGVRRAPVNKRFDSFIDQGLRVSFYVLGVCFYFSSSALPLYEESTEPGTVPQAFALLLCILCLLSSVLEMKQNSLVESSEVAVENLWQCFFIILICVAYVASLEFIGYYAATVPCLFLIILLLRDSIPASLVLTIGWSLFVYIVFELLLGVSLPEGSVWNF